MSDILAEGRALLDEMDSHAPYQDNFCREWCSWLRTNGPALLDLAEAAVSEVAQHAILAERRGYPCDCQLCAVSDAFTTEAP